MGIGVSLVPEGALGIAALASFLVALLDIIALLLLLATLWTYKVTLGAVIEYLVKHTTISTPFGNIPLLFPLEVANNNILHGMSHAALALEVAGGKLFHATGVIFGWMVNLALYSATTMAHAVDWLKHVHIPNAAKWAARVAFPLAFLTKLIADQIRKALTREHKAVRAQVKPVAKAAHAAKTEANAAGHAATKAGVAAHAAIASTGGLSIHPPHALTLPKTWRGLTARLAKLERRLHRAEAWTAAGALAVAMANVLGVSARCLRKGNVGKVARQLCGLSPRAIQDLLGLLVDALILQNICTVITLMEDGLSLIADPLTTWLDGAAAMFVHCNYELVAPDPLDLPYLPPVTGVILHTP